MSEDLTRTEKFRQLLKKKGYSVTSARMAVFRKLLGNEPLSMHELVKEVQGIDRASIYRTVALFERLGIAQRLQTGWKYKLELSDVFADHHHHITCTACGHTTSINEQELEYLVEYLAARHNLVPTAHQIEIQGICQECRE